MPDGRRRLGSLDNRLSTGAVLAPSGLKGAHDDGDDDDRKWTRKKKSEWRRRPIVRVSAASGSGRF